MLFVPLWRAFATRIRRVVRRDDPEREGPFVNGLSQPRRFDLLWRPNSLLIPVPPGEFRGRTGFPEQTLPKRRKVAGRQ